MSTSFVQYRYCSLCRISCKKIKKHVHSPNHQEIVKNILIKFKKKITDAKSFLEIPVAKDVTWNEAERKVWCYFCSCDVELHLPKTTMVGDCVVLNGGFLGHITIKDHSANTAKFLKDNVIDMKRTPEFLLDNEMFLKFLEKTDKISVDYLNEKDRVLKKAASYVRLQTELQRRALHQGLLDQKLQQQSRQVGFVPTPEGSGHHSRPPQSESAQAEIERKKTIQAFGEGLTAIERSNEDDSEGNVYSNAVPPWLRGEQEDKDGDGTIGPSIIDWNKHKKLEQKKKLPLCRVGAKFDHQTSQGDEWLPNFGGVWSHGPRTKAGEHFKKRMTPNSLQRGRGKGQEVFIRQESSTSISSLPSSSLSSSSAHHQNKRKSSTNDHQYHHHPAEETSSSTPSTSTSSHPFIHSRSESIPPIHPSHHQPTADEHFPNSTTPFTSSNSHTNSHTQFGHFDNFTNNDNLYDSTFPVTKTLKPYVSKRRKTGVSVSVSNGLTFSTGNTQEPVNTNTNFYSRGPHPVPSSSHTNFIGYPSMPSFLAPRLLPTPVLMPKK